MLYEAYLMKKLAILCAFVILIAIVPLFTADQKNPNIQQLQSTNPQLYQEIINIKNQIIANLDKIKSLITQNKNPGNEIQNLSKNYSNPLQQDINSLKNQIQDLIQKS
jgi:peptidoglycan hydrolase CwlO-like protein